MPINIGIDISSDKIGLLKPFFEMHFIKWRPFSMFFMFNDTHWTFLDKCHNFSRKIPRDPFYGHWLPHYESGVARYRWTMMTCRHWSQQRLRSGSVNVLCRPTHLLGCLPSTTAQRYCLVAYARLWNSLPSHITVAPSLFTCRSRLISHLFCLSLSYSPISESFSLFYLFSAHTVTLSFWTL